jgi:hypothetical protein
MLSLTQFTEKVEEARMSKDAMALASTIAKTVGKSNASHGDKFDALVAVIAALGVPDSHHVEYAEKLLSSGKRSAEGARICSNADHNKEPRRDRGRS